MVAPGSIADWALFASMLGSLSALAIAGHRWVLREPAKPERVRSHPFIAPAGLPDHVTT
ncbi:MAG: hypothetical protein ACXVEI_12770 [Actinomycetota bacterium]